MLPILSRPVIPRGQTDVALLMSFVMLEEGENPPMLKEDAKGLLGDTNDVGFWRKINIKIRIMQAIKYLVKLQWSTKNVKLKGLHELNCYVSIAYRVSMLSI